LRGLAPHPTETNPRQATRVMRCLTTPRGASVIELHVSPGPYRAGRDGCEPILRDLDRGSLGSRPRARGVVCRLPGELNFLWRFFYDAFDAPVREVPVRRWCDRPRVPVKERGLWSAPCAFRRGMFTRPDACAPGLEREPVTDPEGLADPGPASDALSLFQTLLRRG